MFTNKTEKDLLKMLSEKREALRAFRFGISGSKVRNIKEGRALKKEIARVLTELNSRRGK
jgi:ribosomal protein L29